MLAIAVEWLVDTPELGLVATADVVASDWLETTPPRLLCTDMTFCSLDVPPALPSTLTRVTALLLSLERLTILELMSRLTHIVLRTLEPLDDLPLIDLDTEVPEILLDVDSALAEIGRDTKTLAVELDLAISLLLTNTPPPTSARLSLDIDSTEAETGLETNVPALATELLLTELLIGRVTEVLSVSLELLDDLLLIVLCKVTEPEALDWLVTLPLTKFPPPTSES